MKNIKKLSKELKNLDIDLEIDDFGMGYSSFYRIIQLDFNTIKIDKTMIDLVLENKKAQSIIRHIINMSHSLGVKTLAKGVENKNQLELLKLFGCDYIQGYYISKPLPFEELKEFIKQQNSTHPNP